MHAQVLHAWGDALKYETVAVPKPRAGEALVRVEACGVGLTVLNYIRGNLGHDPAARTGCRASPATSSSAPSWRRAPASSIPASASA